VTPHDSAAVSSRAESCSLFLRAPSPLPHTSPSLLFPYTTLFRSATYAIMMIYSGEVTQAVVHSTFAAFIGALGALLYLIFEYIRRLPVAKRLIAKSANNVNLDFKESIKIMVVDSIPFILLGSGIIIVQLIDTYTFGQILESTLALLFIDVKEFFVV